MYAEFDGIKVGLLACKVFRGIINPDYRKIIIILLSYNTVIINAIYLHFT